jgi:putative ABC transport system substrate-binding protein
MTLEERRARSAILKLLAIGIGVALFSVGAPSVAQPPPRVVRIGYLSPSSQAAARALAQSFVQGMRDRGYADGKNLVVDYRWAEGRHERLPALAAELVELKPDVLVTATVFATRAAQQATASIPIVMVAVADPVGQGFVSSLARPGGSITGLSGQYEDLIQKMLELLNSMVPQVSRVAVLVDQSSPVHSKWLRDLQVGARALGVKLLPMKVSGPDELDNSFATLAKEHPEALRQLPGTLVFTLRKEVVDLALRRQLPAIGPWREFAEAGGLMSYGQNLPENYKSAATYVDKILKGAKPGDLPVEQPTNFELVINLKTAKTLGISVPQSLLLRADKVIE